ncbi:fimbrial protein [Pseudomonas nitroreducens]|uniref:fimbrial protein n=1 Tax=Pseudomonas TaxID=286 RepID=UPI0012FDF2CE|nr:fimbrial protein [Pseudomonas nitroreducens]
MAINSTRKRTLSRSVQAVALGNLFLAMGGLWSADSHAAATCTFNGAASESFSFPGPISVPRDNATPVPLTNWAIGQAVTNIYSCNINNDTEVGIGIKFPTLEQAGTYSEGGITYKVFKTGLDGVGIIYGFRIYSGGQYCERNGGANGWNTYATGSGTVPYSNRFCQSIESNSYNFGAQLQFRLIKTGKIAAGSTPPLTLTFTALDTDTVFSTAIGSKTYVINPVNLQTLACTAEGGDVILDDVHKGAFASATTLKTKPFQFTLRNCPAGMNTIQYQLDPIGTIISAANGTFQNATGDEMAKGVGLRITDETNTSPIRFGDSSYVVQNYDPNAENQTLPIKMNVSYFRTGTAEQVTGGLVRGVAQLTLFYL